MAKVICIILGGGKGTRLYPLTRERAKPAVPFGGKYRLVDIPISNCINSGFKQIYILTQFNSVSLHNHLSNTYIFDVFSKGFVEILAAEQTFENTSWYEGTADAVRKNFLHFHTQNPTHYIILAGDQLYRMNLQEMFKKHVDSGADLSIAATPVTREAANELGLIRTDSSLRALKFYEKPGPDKDISEYRIPESLYTSADGKNGTAENRRKEYLASMGIYIFNAPILEKVLENTSADFGKEIIPRAIEHRNVNTYIFKDFWVDVGTIRSFYDTNLNLASINPNFNFYHEDMPIYTHRRHLPATKINFCTISHSLAAEGSIITNASIVNSLIGVRTLIESGSDLEGVICLGAEFYETELARKENTRQGIPNIGIGRDCKIKNAIIDMNARIGDGCRIGTDNIARADEDTPVYSVRDGIIIIPKGTSLAPGTVI